MPTVISTDGTVIDYDRKGAGGPVLILIGGAIQHRAISGETARMADMLADEMTVITHDRRGRDRSGDTPPYAVAREVEDIAALIDAEGGRASLYGMSSGAILAIEAAAALGDRVERVVGYEPPVDLDQTAEDAWASVARQEEFARNGDGAGAVLSFMDEIGMPAQGIEDLRASPQFSQIAAVGHTICYDLRIIAEATASGFPARWREARAPALIIDGDASLPFMARGADAVAAALPDARRLTLAGQGHEVDVAVLAPILREWVLRGSLAGAG